MNKEHYSDPTAETAIAAASVLPWSRTIPIEPRTKKNSQQIYRNKGTARRVDLVNLLECIDDVLVHYGILADDNSGVIVSHDGSRVLIDRNHPRTEIYITEARNG